MHDSKGESTMCRHHSQRPPATAPDRAVTCRIGDGLRQGWGPLGDGVVLSAASGELMVGGRSIPARESVGRAV
ncbi:DUF5999 family protein [Microbispora rosea]|uniref:DUF5999 family protein n=1 Tax=Microbispora rosea TaxID=58117 RepID=UPI00342BA33B